jgi:recombination protein RecT
VSNIQRFENVKQVVIKSEIDFNKLAKANGVNALDFQKEASFAIQALSKNDYLQGVALSNVDSLKYAVLNVASIGLSLNPVHKLAYLVPRDKQVCLDISYIGLIKLATDCGQMKLIKAELVYEKDKFKYKGLGKEPIHEFEPFKERGALVGAYCIALTHDDKYLVEMMTASQIEGIKKRSEAAKRNSGPWITDFEEMAKKTVIKRASKTWPKTKLSTLLDQAIDVTNNADPIDLDHSPLTQIENQDQKETALNEVTELLKAIERTEEQFLKHLNTSLGRKVTALVDLTEIELNQQTILLKDMVEKRKPKEKDIVVDKTSQDELEERKRELNLKLGIKNENAGTDSSNK